MSAPIPAPSPYSDQEIAAVYDTIVEHYKVGNYSEAIPLSEDLVHAIEARGGRTGTPYAIAVGILARLYQAQGRYDQAEGYLKEALAIDERELDSKHPNIARDLGALGQLYEFTGKFDDAEPLMKRALSIAEENASDPAELGRALNNLAWLYQEQGRLVEAEPLIMRSLSVLQNSLGENDADYARSLDTLAKVYEGQGRVSEAEPLYRRALATLEACLGSEHESIATTLENLGGLLKSQQQLSEAEPLLKRSLAIKQRVYGSGHANLVNVIAQLGDLYRLQGKANEAEAEFQRALAIRKEAIREVPVYFATDRMPQKDSKTIVFGSEQSESLTFGRATIMVAKPAERSDRSILKSPVDKSSASVDPAHIETTEVTRLAIRKVEITESFRSAQQRLDAARVYPKQVFVFVHGFNVSFENALRRAAQIAYDLNFDGVPVLFSWPSRGGLWNYFPDRDNAVTAANHLKVVLEKVVEQTGATKIHLIAHSMGNVVLLDALEKIKLSQVNASNLKFAEIILHSPDVSKNRFSQQMAAIKGMGSAATLYASQSDRALNLSSWIWGERAGAAPSVVEGVETIDATAAGSSFLGLNHDLYVTNPAIFNDMRLVLELGKHPPDQRSPAFEPINTPQGTYWHYRRQADVQKKLTHFNAVLSNRNAPSLSGYDGRNSNDVLRSAQAKDEEEDRATPESKVQQQERSDARALEETRQLAEELRRELEFERAERQRVEQSLREVQTAKEVAETEAAEARQQLEHEREARMNSERQTSLNAKDTLPGSDKLVARGDAALTTGGLPDTANEPTSGMPTSKQPRAARRVPRRSAHKRTLPRSDAQKVWPFVGWN